MRREATLIDVGGGLEPDGEGPFAVDEPAVGYARFPPWRRAVVDPPRLPWNEA